MFGHYGRCWGWPAWLSRRAPAATAQEAGAALARVGEVLSKGLVRAHTRTLASGARVQVAQHQDSRQGSLFGEASGGPHHGPSAPAWKGDLPTAREALALRPHHFEAMGDDMLNQVHDHIGDLARHAQDSGHSSSDALNYAQEVALGERTKRDAGKPKMKFPPLKAEDHVVEPAGTPGKYRLRRYHEGGGHDQPLASVDHDWIRQHLHLNKMDPTKVRGMPEYDGGETVNKGVVHGHTRRTKTGQTNVREHHRVEPVGLHVDGSPGTIERHQGKAVLNLRGKRYLSHEDVPSADDEDPMAGIPLDRGAADLVDVATVRSGHGGKWDEDLLPEGERKQHQLVREFTGRKSPPPPPGSVRLGAYEARSHPSLGVSVMKHGYDPDTGESSHENVSHAIDPEHVDGAVVAAREHGLPEEHEPRLRHYAERSIAHMQASGGAAYSDPHWRKELLKKHGPKPNAPEGAEPVAKGLGAGPAVTDCATFTGGRAISNEEPSGPHRKRRRRRKPKPADETLTDTPDIRKALTGAAEVLAASQGITNLRALRAWNARPRGGG